MVKVETKAKAARDAALELASTSTKLRNTALLNAASGISKHREEVLEANAKDMDAGMRMLKSGKYSKALLQRLKLDETKLSGVVKMAQIVAGLEDPLGKTLYAMELDKGLELFKVSCPIGVVGAIFEARPDVLPQISSLCLKSGNAVILKGGREAKNSNEVLFKLMKDATETAGIPKEWIQLIEAREEVREMLKLDKYIDLLVPRGSNEFVKFIQTNTNIPVLGHSEGICHIYVDERADLKKALNICYDAKVQYPAVCNAVETVLVHEKIAESFLPQLARRYEQAGVEIRGCDQTRKILKHIKRATERDWHTEYLDLVISIKIADGLQEAIDHINTRGSKHTDAIITEDKGVALRFLNGVDSSSVMVNASTRFSDGYRYGLGAEVGISTGKIHARGPVGLEGLTSSKYYLIGNGQVVSTYVGKNAKPFAHKKLVKSWAEVAKQMKGENS